MSGQFDVTALIFAAIAVIVFLKLRSVLGRRTEDDEARIERYRSQRAKQQQQGPQSDGNIVTLPRRDRDDGRTTDAPVATRPSDADVDLKMTKFAGGNAPLAQGLIQIVRADPAFDPGEFMNGAKAAYEMIVQGYANGDRKLLADLLSSDVFNGFVGAIKAREEARETIEQSFVGTKAADMLEAELRNGTAQVTVKFISEIISATKSASGDVISGDPKRIKEVTDVWTFARDVRARDPNWKLVATQAAS